MIYPTLPGTRQGKMPDIQSLLYNIKQMTYLNNFTTLSAICQDLHIKNGKNISKIYRKREEYISRFIHTYIRYLKKGAVKKHSNLKGGLIKQKENKQALQKHENKANAKLVCFLRDKSGFVCVFVGEDLCEFRC